MRHRIPRQAFLVEQLVRLLALQGDAGVGDGHLPGGGLLAEHALHHIADIDRHALAGLEIAEIDALGRRVGDGNLDLAILQLPGAQHAAEFRARVGGGLLAHQGGDQPLLGREFGAGQHVLAAGIADHDDAGLDQIAHDALHITADIADLGEFRRLHLEERRLCQLGQAAGDLGFAAAGRPDHQDVLRHHLLAHALRQLLPPPAIAQRDGHRLFRVMLADNETVQLAHDLTRGEGRDFEGHQIVSTVREWLV